MRKGHTEKNVFTDECLLYYSRSDQCWIGHSLRTDQIGTGDCVLDSLADLMSGIKKLLELAAEDETITIYREAPASIKKRAEKATLLPEEIFEIAYKKVYGDWPGGDVHADFPHKPWKIIIKEPLCA